MLVALLMLGFTTSAAVTVRRLKKALFFHRRSKQMNDPIKRHNCRKRWYSHMVDTTGAAMVTCFIGLLAWVVTASATGWIPPFAIPTGLFCVMAATSIAYAWAKHHDMQTNFIQHHVPNYL